MANKLTIDCITDDIASFQAQYIKFLALNANLRYDIIKDVILSSTRAIFFNMTGSFMYGAKESTCMKFLKNISEKYSSFAIDWSGKIENLHDGTCYSLDISTNNQKKMFLDNYRFYDHADFKIDLPELNTAFKVADDRSYEPYSFYFLSDMKLKMFIEHHTREVGIFNNIGI